ncbi:centromere/kinetochore protein zw10 homolog [Dermacentor andersoni]|uniref:centromere/kinetochore protein zw10 homolog n=1 Tax=Dermacentor andersoni TaxID=34620 RepID=UPI0021558C6F|nr:centromere/kinetochore protein zw10 homolog [Dermacentor andersoni]
MSLVAEVLQPKEPLEKGNLKAAVSRLSRKIDDLKTDMQKELVSKYDMFLPYYRDAEHLMRCLKAAVEDVEEVFKNIEDHVKPRLVQSTTEFEVLSRELATIEQQSSQIRRYARLHELLEEAEAQFVSEDLLACSQLLEEVGSVVSELEGDRPEMQLVDALHTEHVIRSERLIYKLSEVWKRYIIWKVGRTPHVTELTVATVEKEEAEAFARLVEAVQRQGQLREKMSRFGRSLLADIVTPMVKYESVIVTSLDSSTFRVEFNESKAPLVKDVLANLSTLFTFLTNRLRAHGVIGVDLIKAMGSVIGTEFSDTVAKCCLEPAVPSDGSRLDSYPASALLDFHNQLVATNFLSSEKTGFSNLVSNLEALCISKQSQSILLQARAIMKQELHDTVVVGEPPLSRKQMSSLEHCLYGSPFKFPRCQVSKFVEELVALLKTMVDGAKDSSDGSSTEQAWQVGAVRHICELYCCVAPVHHQHAIETIPVQTAIHHNNCLYLAHELLCLGVWFHGRTTLVDVASRIRWIGRVALCQQVDSQRKHLLDFLNEVSISENNQGLDAALRRCLFHIEQLKRVWLDVLPITSYLETVGSLLNSVLEHVVKSVVGMEDIASTLSEELAQVFEKVVDQAVNIFDIPACSSDGRILASDYVATWRKFCELKNLLRFNLREVMDRWADGRGPLAACFMPDELKRLIRALFQNTDRRAAALAQIR